MFNHQYKKSYLLLYFLVGIFGQLIGQNPNWTSPSPSAFDYSASGICVIKVDDLQSNHIEDRIALFVNNEIRGLSTPIAVGPGTYIHFITAYSNVAMEDMDIRIYKHSTNLVYGVTYKFSFKLQTVIGDITDPFAVNGYTDGDSPIGLLLIPAQTTYEGVPFTDIDLLPYLIQPDNTPVVWSYFPNPNVNVVLNGSVLSITPADGFTGKDSIIVRVMEVSPNQKFSDARVVFTVDGASIPPTFTGLPNQAINIGGSFTDINLNDYENTYDGNCLTFDYAPIIEPATSPAPFPDWNFTNIAKTNMTFLIQSQYTPKHIFNNAGDRMAIFIGNELRAVSFPVMQSGKILYFLTLGGENLETEKIEIRFYSGALRKVFSKVTNFTFIPHVVVGGPDDPYILDFSPLEPIIDAAGNFHMAIRDSSWIGEQKFVIKSFDCKYPQYASNQQTVCYCVMPAGATAPRYYIDRDGDGFGNPSLSFMACTPPEYGWVDNNLDCNDSDPTQSALEFVITVSENAVIPNDRHICSGTPTVITVSGGDTYLWSTGSTSSTLSANPDTTIQYLLTISSLDGCTIDTSVTLTVESNVVTSSIDAGPGTLRSVLECVVDGGIVYFDQPITNLNVINETLTIDKNVTIIGLSPNIRPYIGLDFDGASPVLSVSNGKTLNLRDVDLHLINQANNEPSVSGSGQVIISGYTKVIKVD